MAEAKLVRCKRCGEFREIHMGRESVENYESRRPFCQSCSQLRRFQREKAVSEQHARASIDKKPWYKRVFGG